MTEFIAVIKEILTAETGAGELLEGLGIFDEDHEGLTTPCLLIRPDIEITIAQQNRYKSVEGRALLFAMAQINKRDGAATDWRDARVLADGWARKVEKIIMRNPKLISSTYPNGFTNLDQKTQLVSKEYDFDVNGPATWWAFMRMVFKAEYIYKDGVITLE